MEIREFWEKWVKPFMDLGGIITLAVLGVVGYGVLVAAYKIVTADL